jgi:hypothetical protein
MRQDAVQKIDRGKYVKSSSEELGGDLVKDPAETPKISDTDQAANQDRVVEIPVPAEKVIAYV